MCKILQVIMENPPKKILKIVIVDDSSIITERLKYILNEIECVEISGNANTISSANKLANTVNPDVIILDINLSDDEYGKTAIDLLVDFRQNLPKTKIIIFTNQNELHYRLICLEKGANYFFDKSKDSYKIFEVIKQWTTK